MQYFILRTPGHPDELARWRRRSAAAYYDPAAQKWIADPLLAPEILAGDDWRRIAVSDLPPELPDVEPVVGDRPARSRNRNRIVGRRRLR
jgi:hypothetical protein